MSQLSGRSGWNQEEKTRTRTILSVYAALPVSTNPNTKEMFECKGHENAYICIIFPFRKYVRRALPYQRRLHLVSLFDDLTSAGLIQFWFR
jgi:hypothetical protein